MTARMDEADFVIVGGGSAGCILAGRLASAGLRVLLLEAGDAAEAHPETLSADGFGKAFAGDATMWQRMSVKMAKLGRKYVGTGRGMGGSGSVNGMVYTRGDKQDFSAWPDGWKWGDCEPAFAAVEAELQPKPRFVTPYVQRLIDACEQVGMTAASGMLDGELKGKVGANAMNYAGQKRRSSYRAWIKEPFEVKGHPIREHLRIKLAAQVEALVFEGQRAVAVRYRHQGQVFEVKVGQEVIMAAGALETPRILQLSGVGAAEHLRRLDIPVVLDAPRIGENLQDHMLVTLFYKAAVATDFQHAQVYAFDTADGRPGAPDTCWVGLAAHAHLRLAMHRMVPIMLLPEALLKLQPLRWLLRKVVDGVMNFRPLDSWVQKVFGIVVILGKPTARGSVRIASRNPQQAAEIDVAWLSTEADRQLLERGIERARQMAAAPSFADAKLRPLSAGAKPGVTGAKLWRWVHKASMTSYHFCGTCSMGADATSPVDPSDLRVKGLSNVRVADASAIPDIPVSALNAPSMMVAWRAADFILKEYQDARASSTD